MMAFNVDIKKKKRRGRKSGKKARCAAHQKKKKKTGEKKKNRRLSRPLLFILPTFWLFTTCRLTSLQLLVQSLLGVVVADVLACLPLRRGIRRSLSLRRVFACIAAAVPLRQHVRRAETHMAILALGQCCEGHVGTALEGAWLAHFSSLSSHLLSLA